MDYKRFSIFAGLGFGAMLVVLFLVNNPPQISFGATPPIQVFQGGTGSTTLGGILRGNNGTTSVKSVTIGAGLTFDGTTLTNSGAAFSYPFSANATSSTITFNGGITVGGTGTSTFQYGLLTSGFETPYARLGYFTSTSSATSTLAGGLVITGGALADKEVISCNSGTVAVGTDSNGDLFCETLSFTSATSSWNGTVVSGTANQLAVYSVNGQTLSGLSTSTWNGTVASGNQNQLAVYSVTGQTVTGLSTSTWNGTVNAGIIGQVSYYNAANQSIVGTSSLFIDTNQFVGIGSTSPKAFLSISATTTNASDLFAVSTTTGNATTTTLRVDKNGNLILGNTAGITPFPNGPLTITGNVNNTLQTNCQNLSAGSLASCDYVVTDNSGSNTTYYGDFGVNSSGNTDASYTILPAHAVYLYASDGELDLGTATTTGNGIIKFFTGGSLTSNERMRIGTSTVGIGTTTPGAFLSLAGSGKQYNGQTNPTHFATATDQLLFSGVNLAFASSSTTTIPNVVNAFMFATTSSSTNPLPILSIDGLNGRIAIGTSSPVQTLVVNGTAFISASSSFNGLTVSNGGIRDIQIPSCSGGSAVMTNASGDLTCGTTTGTISGVQLGSNLNSISVSTTLSGTSYNGSATVSDWAINLGNANTWTALQNNTNVGTTTYRGAFYSALDIGSSKSIFANAFTATSTTATSTFSGGVSIVNGLLIPSSASTTFSTITGQIQINTTQASTSILYYDGTGSRVLSDIKTIQISHVASTSLSTTATNTVAEVVAPFDLTILSLFCDVESDKTPQTVGTSTVKIGHGTDSNVTGYMTCNNSTSTAEYSQATGIGSMKSPTNTAYTFLTKMYVWAQTNNSGFDYVNVYARVRQNQ